eukprot:3173458-Heterocapsa_arctica.AAC.1
MEPRGKPAAPLVQQGPHVPPQRTGRVPSQPARLQSLKQRPKAEGTRLVPCGPAPRCGSGTAAP